MEINMYYDFYMSLHLNQSKWAKWYEDFAAKSNVQRTFRRNDVTHRELISDVLGFAFRLSRIFRAYWEIELNSLDFIRFPIEDLSHLPICTRKLPAAKQQRIKESCIEDIENCVKLSPHVRLSSFFTRSRCVWEKHLEALCTVHPQEFISPPTGHPNITTCQQPQLTLCWFSNTHLFKPSHIPNGECLSTPISLRIIENRGSRFSVLPSIMLQSQVTCFLT